MFGCDTIIVLGLVIVLNHVIPQVPFPDYFSLIFSNRFNFNNLVWPKTSFRNEFRFSSCLDSLLHCFFLPGQKKNISVWHDGNIMMSQVIFCSKFIIPDQFTIPGKLLQASSLSSTTKHGCIRLPSASDKISIILQV